MKHFFSKASAIYTIIFAIALQLVPAGDAHAEKYFKLDDGVLERPVGYREWIYVGTPVTPNDMNSGKAAFPEFHNVYIDPKSWKVWKKTGEFPEGTILIKELVSVGSKAAVSGAGYFQGKFLGLEATIKSKKHFPDEPGHWAYFSFSTPEHKTLTETAKAFPTAACNACHQASAATDWVFTQYYPVLSAGKGAGKKAVGGISSKLK
ncbi:MAG: cytochrome P460 family protein [Pseudomonadota bacterium]